MARTKRIKSAESAFYHVISRITGQAKLLKDPEIKNAMLNILAKVAAFSGVDIGSFAILDNHFHLLVHVPKLVSPITDEEVFRRITLLKGKAFSAAFQNHIKFLLSHNQAELAQAEIDRFRKRMGDLSQFVKTFKEYFNVWYKSRYKYSGGLWAGRFKSVLIEDGVYLQRCREYIEMNPVRANLAETPEDYAWCTKGAAKGGSVFAKKCRAFMSEHFLGKGELSGKDREKLLKRIAQLSLGKIFGSREFVEGGVSEHFAALRGAFARIREVAGLGYSSHGHKGVA